MMREDTGVSYHDEAGSQQPLLPRTSSCRMKEAAVLLLAIKLCSNAYEFQMMAYNVIPFDSYNDTTCKYRKHLQSNMFKIESICSSAVAFMLPLVGGVLSDACLGWRRVMWLGTVLQVVGSLLLTTLDRFGIVCLLSPYFLSWTFVLLHLSVTDTAVYSVLMQLNSDRRSLQLLLFFYFVAAATGETIGYVPSLLRSLMQISYEIIILPFSIVEFVCMSLLCEAPVANARFEMPRLRRFRRFYRIAAGCIPHLTCIAICRTLYIKEMRFFTNAKEETILSSYAGFIGYQGGTILLSLIFITVLLADRMPTWFTLRMRIQTGLWLMLITKVPLLLINVFDYTGAIDLSTFSVISLSAIYTIFSFCDGVTNALTTAGFYELVYCISEKCARATFIGIFFTVWGLMGLLDGLVLLCLQSCGVIILNSEDSTKPMSFYAYGCVIIFMIISLIYWQKISWPQASLLLTDYEYEEEDRIRASFILLPTAEE